MAYQDQISSLSVINDHLIECIDEATQALDAYHKHEPMEHSLKVCMKNIHQANRVFHFIELKGAEQLTKELLRGFRQLPPAPQEEHTSLLDSISFGMTLLVRYLKYIANKPFDLPQLLLVPINDLRAATGEPPFIESTLFQADHQKVRPEGQADLLDPFDRAKLSRRLRQMFQIGLIEVIRKTNINGGLAMMNRALGRLDNQCGCPSAPNLWWVAGGAIEGFNHGGLVLSPARLKLFTRLDLQMRALAQVDDNLNIKNREEAETLTFELLYLVSLSDATDQLTTTLKQHFELATSGVTETMLSQEFIVLKGLSEDDYGALYQAIKDDVELLQTDLITNDYDAGSSDLDTLLLRLKHLHSLFTILGFAALEEQIEQNISLVNGVVDEQSALPDNVRRKVSDLLAQIDVTLSQQDQQDLNPSALRRQKLDSDQLEACTDARRQVQLIIKQLEHYADENNSPELLESVPATLEHTLRAIEKLDSEILVNLVHLMIDVFNDYFAKQPATPQALEMVADVLASIEFYLETKQQNYDPSQKILNFAEDTLEKLAAYITTQVSP